MTSTVPLGRVAILAAWWGSRFQLARELRRQGIPAIGPGARPYKRNHPVAPLMEAVGAYLECRDGITATGVQRALFMLLAEFNEQSPRAVFGFGGPVAVCRLLAEAKIARANSGRAIDWIVDVAGRFSQILAESQLLSQSGSAALTESANQMVEDLCSRARLRLTGSGSSRNRNIAFSYLRFTKPKAGNSTRRPLLRQTMGAFLISRSNGFRTKPERDAQYNESRRVIYVATTRAMRTLMFFRDRTHYRNTPTPFLQEMGL